MEEYFDLLMGLELFRGISAFGLERMLHCFRPALHRFQKGDVLLLGGYESHEIGILLEGEAEEVKSTPDGVSVSITALSSGSVFGEALAGCSVKSPVTVMAKTACLALYLPIERVLTPCSAMHPEHMQLLQNLVRSISEKYLALNSRVDLLILKSLRSKLCAYLLSQSAQAGADTFSIPLSRAGLAEYLNCERSALCRELSRMRAEGLIETYKNSFKLLDKAALQRHYEY